MARIESIDSLLKRVTNPRNRADIDRVIRDTETLSRRLCAGELPSDLDSALAAMNRSIRLTNKMSRSRR